MDCFTLMVTLIHGKNGIYLNKLVLNLKNVMDEKESGTDPT